MTEQTKLALQQATEAYAAVEAEATAQKRACLAQLAADLPDRVLAIAKTLAKAEPDVTKQLGKPGIESLRASLREAAVQLGQTLMVSMDAIDWPSAGQFGAVETHNINDALLEKFSSRHGAFDHVVEGHNYSPEYNAFHLTKLYDHEQFQDAATALTALGRAEYQLKKAKEADDDATVDELWGE